MKGESFHEENCLLCHYSVWPGNWRPAKFKIEKSTTFHSDANNIFVFGKWSVVMELVELLMKNLGVGEDQAKGGAGLVFNLVKEKLGASDFSQVAEHVPGIGEMLNAAPESGGGIGGVLGGLASSLGGESSFGDLVSLAGGFSKLGLDNGMIGKSAPTILSFVQSKGGDVVRGILEKALK